jgi:hypothetical protein
VEISGNDLWIGYEVHHDLGDFAAGCDAGPAVAGYGDMISLDGIFYEPMSGLGLDYNWNIAATLTGDSMLEWLSIDPESASIPAGQSVVFDVTADFSLPPDYTNDYFWGTIWMTTNDPLNPLVEIPFMVIPDNIDENDAAKNDMMVYPNPGKDFVNIKSEINLNSVNIFNQNGQMIYSQNISAKEFQIDTHEFQSGIYLLQAESEKGVSQQKLVVQ